MKETFETLIEKHNLLAEHVERLEAALEMHGHQVGPKKGPLEAPTVPMGTAFWVEPKVHNLSPFANSEGAEHIKGGSKK